MDWFLFGRGHRHERVNDSHDTKLAVCKRSFTFLVVEKHFLFGINLTST